ncbi:DUF6372 family protein [Streptomyces sp. NPDC058662]|uniref:DUF6372 family protein n=1 Tax=Streptomyces sp. NPDC058662 TaxID=3346583 RepID=UPI00364D34EC
MTTPLLTLRLHFLVFWEQTQPGGCRCVCRLFHSIPGTGVWKSMGSSGNLADTSRWPCAELSEAAPRPRLAVHPDSRPRKTPRRSASGSVPRARCLAPARRGRAGRSRRGGRTMTDRRARRPLRKGPVTGFRPERGPQRVGAEGFRAWGDVDRAWSEGFGESRVRASARSANTAWTCGCSQPTAGASQRAGSSTRPRLRRAHTASADERTTEHGAH